MTDPNIVTSGLSKKVLQDGVHLSIEIYRLEHEQRWALEIVDEDGTSTVWDEAFDTDQDALDEALNAIEKEGVSAFLISGNVVPFPR